MTEEFEIVSKEKAFWITKKELSQKMVSTLEIDLKDIPQLIEFHKAVVLMCEARITQFKE